MHKRIVCLGLALSAAFCWTAQAQWNWTPQTGRWVNIKRMPRETPELQIEYARSLMLEGDYKKALRETQKFEKFYSESDLSDENLYLRGEIRLAQGDLKGAAKQFQQLTAAYPDTDLYDQAVAKQYEIGDLYYERAQKRMAKRFRPFKYRPLRRAIDIYAQVIDTQPFTAAAAEAQYKLGLCHYARKEYVEAAFEYRRVIEDYAGSDYVDEAGYGLAMCYYEASHPADYDQTPSQLAIDAIDHFAERYPTDPRLDELKPKRQEMRDVMAEQRIQTAKIYEKQRRFDSARIYYEVVVSDFGDTSWAQEAQGWLDKHPKAETEAQAQVRTLREAAK